MHIMGDMGKKAIGLLGRLGVFLLFPVAKLSVAENR